jgi:2-dehydropantoate 2-reductase
MRIPVIGAGALGGYFGACLVRAGRDVTFMVRPHHAAQLARTGLQVTSPHGDFAVPVKTILPEGIREPLRSHPARRQILLARRNDESFCAGGRT